MLPIPMFLLLISLLIFTEADIAAAERMCSVKKQVCEETCSYEDTVRALMSCRGVCSTEYNACVEEIALLLSPEA